LMHIAPHLVHPMQFIIPVHSLFLNISMALGVTLYDIISYNKTLPNHQYLNKNKTLLAEPGLKIKNLQGSYLYYDCQIPFTERLNLETAISAYEAGANVINHARLTGIIKNGNVVTGVIVQDEITGESLEATGRIVVNASGQWVDEVKDMIFQNKQPYLRRTKGVHILIDKVSEHALVLFSQTDGRLFFVIPWEGYSLVGTTDTDYEGNLDQVVATKEDVQYILDGLHIAFPDIKSSDIYYTYAGLRSLALKPGKSASNTSRSHELIDHSKRDGLEGIITVLGGKITAYRAVARDATDMICEKLLIDRDCVTGENLLPGASFFSEQDIKQLSDENYLNKETVNHLTKLYGSRCREIIRLSNQNTSGQQPISPGGLDIVAQIWHSMKYESCLTISDFMLRRSSIGFRKDLGMDAINRVADEMKKYFGWTNDQTNSQKKDYISTCEIGLKYKQI
jgi:glycerol-3-phosphate dehydrogenase